MNEFNPFKNIFLKKEGPNPLRAEHLKEGAAPIMGAIIDSAHIDEDTRRTIEKITTSGEFVDYYGDYEDLRRQNMQSTVTDTEGVYGYVISACNEKDKYSERYTYCTGVVVVGTDRNTGKNISILSHHDPQQFDHEYRQFKPAFLKSLKEIIARSLPKTIDSMVYGGSDRDGRIYYKRSIKTLSTIITDECGFEPVVLNGPNAKDNRDNDNGARAYFDNEHRRLYLVRAKQENNFREHPYLPSKMRKQARNW